MILRIIGLIGALMLVGCGASKVEMAQIQNELAQLNNRVSQVESDQQVLREEVANNRIQVPTGITAVPAQRRSGVYDDQPIRNAAGLPDGFEQGLSLYRAGDVANAITTFEQYIAQSVQHGGDEARINMARYWLGDAYYTERQYESASRYLGQYLRDDPNGEKSTVALDKLSKSLRAIGRTQDADLLDQHGAQAIIRR